MQLTRRRVLAGLGLSVGGLAGCSGSGGDQGNGGNGGNEGTEGGDGAGIAASGAITGTFQSLRADNANTGHATGRSGPTTALDSWWRFSETLTDSSYRLSTPVVGEGAVYVLEAGVPAEPGSAQTTEARNGNGEGTDRQAGRKRLLLAALEPTSGDVLWRHTVPGEYHPHTPTLRNGHLYAPMGPQVLVFDAESGDILRRLDGSVEGPVTVNDDGWCYRISEADGRRQLSGTAPDSSEPRWREPLTGNWLQGPPAVDEDVVLGAGRLRVFERGDHGERWRRDVDLSAPPTLHDGDVVGGTQSGDVGVWGLAEGRERWRATPETLAQDDGPGPIAQAVAVTDDLVVVSIDGSVTAFDRGSGEKRWHQSVPTGGAPVVTNGRIYVNGLSDLEVLAVDDGETLASREWASGAFRTGVAVVDDVAFAGGATLHALR